MSSYHYEYEWNKIIVDTAKKILEEEKICEIREFYLDTIRKNSVNEIKHKALEAKKLIESWKPDVTIAADDNASRHVVAPFFRNSHRNFVFCGVNWSVKEYGYPYINATGMVEVLPLKPLIENSIKIFDFNFRKLGKKVKSLACLTSNRNSDVIQCQRLKKITEQSPYELSMKIVTPNTFSDWKKDFKNTQDNFDIVVFHNYQGIKNWDNYQAKQFVKKNIKKITVTTESWMHDYTMFIFEKVAEEQGEYAAETAIKVLNGQRPIDIPIIPNRIWNFHANSMLIKDKLIKVPPSMLSRLKNRD